MAKVNVLTMEGKDAGTMELKDEIFGIEPNQNAVLEMVKNHLANKRQGTQSAKDRGEVRGSTRKPFRQKGTGRARAGSSRSPLWIGGGVIFAPKSRDYSKKVNKKVKNLAMRSVFSAKTADQGDLIIPVVITVYADRSFSFITKTPPAAVLLKKAAGIQKASGEPNKTKVATVTKAQVKEIAEKKMPDLNAASVEAAMSMIAGTARSMGITVVD